MGGYRRTPLADRGRSNVVVVSLKLVRDLAIVKWNRAGPGLRDSINADGVIIPALAFAAVEATVLNRLCLRQTDQISCRTIAERTIPLDFDKQDFAWKIE